MFKKVIYALFFMQKNDGPSINPIGGGICCTSFGIGGLSGLGTARPACNFCPAEDRFRWKIVPDLQVSHHDR